MINSITIYSGFHGIPDVDERRDGRLAGGLCRGDAACWKRLAGYLAPLTVKACQKPSVSPGFNLHTAFRSAYVSHDSAILPLPPLPSNNGCQKRESSSLGPFNLSTDAGRGARRSGLMVDFITILAGIDIFITMQKFCKSWVQQLFSAALDPSALHAQTAPGGTKKRIYRTFALAAEGMDYMYPSLKLLPKLGWGHQNQLHRQRGLLVMNTWIAIKWW